MLQLPNGRHSGSCESDDSPGMNLSFCKLQGSCWDTILEPQVHCVPPSGTRLWALPMQTDELQSSGSGVNRVSSEEPPVEQSRSSAACTGQNSSPDRGDFQK